MIIEKMIIKFKKNLSQKELKMPQAVKSDQGKTAIYLKKIYFYHGGMPMLKPVLVFSKRYLPAFRFRVNLCPLCEKVAEKCSPTTKWLPAKYLERVCLFIEERWKKRLVIWPL